MPVVLLIIIFIFLLWGFYRFQWRSLRRPRQMKAEFGGAPCYVAGSTSGSPLSELGSHCGFKAIPDSTAACSGALFAAVTSFGAGRLADFSVLLSDPAGRSYFRQAQWRKINFSPCSIEERSADGDVYLKSKLHFLQRNLAILETSWSVRGIKAMVRPSFLLKPTGGRDLENPYPHFNGFTFYRERAEGIMLKNYHRLPGLKMYAFFLPVKGDVRGKRILSGPQLELGPGDEYKWSVLISFSPDSEKDAVSRARRALSRVEILQAAAAKRRAVFEARLPQGCAADGEVSRVTLCLAAWALQNNLYYRRGAMAYWGSVPAKVYFPFFWGWDTPQHVIGLSEWHPKRAGEVLLNQLQGNYFAPRRPRFNLRLKGISFIAGVQRHLIPSKLDDSLRGVLDFYSQPPLQSWAAVRVYERLEGLDEKAAFLERVLPPLMDNLRWWEDNRRLSSGFYSYINGLESGLDDSPRFYPPGFLPSFVIGLIPRFFSAVDLNCWIYQSYLNVAYLCEQAGRDQEAQLYREQGEKLGDQIDEGLWSEPHRAWLDRRNGKFIEVITPAVWWPAFCGASNDLEKIRGVIETHLLEPDRFWGRHGIPSVAFNDKSFNSRKDGYYWRGQIWMINNYSALETLYRFGYQDEAAELHEKVVNTLYNSRGMFETYNALTGEAGWSSRGPGDPSVMQFGMTSAWATQILYHRYQHFRFIFPETMELCGHVQWASLFDRTPSFSPPGPETPRQEAVFTVRVPGADSYSVPLIHLRSMDGRPLLSSSLVSLRIDLPKMWIGRTGTIEFDWLGQQYLVCPGQNYHLRPRERLLRQGSA